MDLEYLPAVLGNLLPNLFGKLCNDYILGG
jgi:hypothetical protein